MTTPASIASSALALALCFGGGWVARGCAEAPAEPATEATAVTVHPETIDQAAVTVDAPSPPTQADVFAREQPVATTCIELPARLAPTSESTPIYAPSVERSTLTGAPSAPLVTGVGLRYDPTPRRLPWLLLPIRDGLPAVTITSWAARVEVYDPESHRASVLTYAVPRRRWGWAWGASASVPLRAPERAAPSLWAYARYRHHRLAASLPLLADADGHRFLSPTLIYSRTLGGTP